ncbi:MAG TPA: hypothetical protein VMT16_15930 [Thermoanaerobaculia bacterium]|nr:hypothetical protein [Thermoanaerobaculia bacterium]
MTHPNRNPSRKPAWIAAVAAAILALPTALPAQPVESVRVSVRDPQSHNELRVLAADDVLELGAGETVLLNVFAPARTAGGERRYLDARFSVHQGQQRLEVEDLGGGRALVTATPLGNPGDQRAALAVAWELPAEVEVAHRSQRRGALPVRIVPRDRTPEPAVLEQLVANLYQGILLRAPEPGAATSAAERLRAGGYPALVQLARDIANSRESQITVYERSCNQQRLLALHRHLLGHESGDIEQGVWQRQLDLMARGQIAEVVDTMVQSPAFRNRHGLGARTRR